MTSLMERLEALVAAANEPPPKSSPEQDSRAGEAMAGVEDQRRFARWADRVDDAQRQLVALAPELLAERQSLSDRIDVLEARQHGGENGAAGDAIDFACDHAKEPVFFLEDWRKDGAQEWPEYHKWLAVQRAGAAEARAALHQEGIDG